MKYISILLTLTVLLFIFLQVQTTSIQCQYQPSKWKPNQGFILSEREELVPTIYKVDVVVDRTDYAVSKTIKQLGTWEPIYLRTMARFVKPGDTVLNIGSHIGLEAMVLGKIAGPKGKLFIFQPFRVSRNLLIKNVHLNELDDITTVYPIGASNRYSKAYIAIDTVNTGASGVFTDLSMARPTTIPEEIIVDLVDNNLPKDAIVDFVLIDVERAQVDVLQGMKETILRSPNIVIQCEWSSQSNNSRDEKYIKQKIKNLIQWFLSLKFKFYRLNERSTTNCNHQFFREVSLDYIMSLPDPFDEKTFPDIFFVPGHIDPNKTF